MSQRSQSGFSRGIAVLAIVAMGALAVTPAFSAAGVTKKKAKKIAKKQATAVLQARIDDFGDPIFIEEDEVVRFAGTASLGTTDQTIATIGPSSFTLLLTCEDSGGGMPRILLEIRTSENGSILESRERRLRISTSTPARSTWWRITPRRTRTIRSCSRATSSRRLPAG